MDDLLTRFQLPAVFIMDGDDDLTDITRDFYDNKPGFARPFSSVEHEVVRDSALPVVA